MKPIPQLLHDQEIPVVTYRKILTSRNVPQLLLAASLSRLAHGMLLLVVVLYSIAEFDSAAVAGMSGFFLTLPGFLISPIAGAVLDRFGALRAVAMDTAASAVLIGGIGVFSLVGNLTPGVLYVLLALFSLTSPLTDGGIRTLFPQFVPDIAYDKANALDLSTYSAIEVGGPLVAGSLFAWAGANPALFTVVGLYALATLSLALLRGDPKPAPKGERQQHLLRAAWEGITYLLRNSTLRGLAASYSLFQVSYGMLILIVPVAVTEWVTPGSSSGRYVGLIWAVVGLCGGLGALAAGKLVRSGVERRYMVGATAVASAAIFPISALGSLVALGAGLALFGLMEGTVNVSLLSLRQRRTDPGWIGRIMTVSISVNLIGFPVGTALGGFLVGATTPAKALAVAAALTLASAVCARLLVPKEA
ncbi:MFS transporter [Streptomyces sp. NBC_00859]|uniref:MFS transporter n=1 Tax=Streptomyces sp. NBC_00859 TaxID=2903682 RepID=UPI0038689C92|nr:MFS transporter [Streptomyces sp. NBC_00859]WSZ86790.1 MFS transporter [Streptomyces sp. NBC_00859]